MNIILLSPFIFALFLFKYSNSSLWSETGRMSDMQQWRLLCSRYQVAQAYMEDVNARITIFAPVNDVFLYNPDLRAMDQKEVLSHIVDTQVNELSSGRRWEKQTLIRSTINSGYIYITQFENPGPPGNFSYFANAGTICNYVSNQWGIITGEQYLYKVCTPMGHRPYPGTALGFVRDDENAIFVDRHYDNRDLTELRNILDRVPDIALVIYGSSAWNGFHTFFLPTNKAFAKVIDRNRVDREVLLAHVSGMNRVLFTYPWLYDGGIHFYPSIRFSSNIIEDNYKLKLSLRNITDHRTGKWDLYVVTSIYERYGEFRRGAVWAKILVPNIPVQNGVVHIIDNVLGIVTNTIDQMLMDNYRCTTLMRFMATIGQIVRNYMSATGGLVTFFAPWNEAFERIPEPIERRLLRDRIWLEQILKLHIIPAKELVTEEITNDTIIATVDNMRHLYFSKTEWPKNNITYYVIGGGIRTAIQMEDVTATNGIIHYIDRVLGVPYQSLWEVLRNETRAQRSMEMLNNLQLKYSLDPWQVLTPEQNMTFFVPIDEAWDRVSPAMKNKLLDGNHWQALQYVYKRHILQGQALMYTDLRERTYVMMNDEKVIIRRRGRYFELYWPRGNRVARIIEGGEIAGINGFMHLIDGVLIYEPDIRAGSKNVLINSQLLLILMLFILFDYTTRIFNLFIWITMIEVAFIICGTLLIICTIISSLVFFICNKNKLGFKADIALKAAGFKADVEIGTTDFITKTMRTASESVTGLSSPSFMSTAIPINKDLESKKSSIISPIAIASPSLSTTSMLEPTQSYIENKRQQEFILFKTLFSPEDFNSDEYLQNLDQYCLYCHLSKTSQDKVQTEEQKMFAARHEATHGCLAFDNGHVVEKISIIPTDKYVAVTEWRNKKNNCSRTEVMSRLQITAGGPASDKFFYKDQFSGSAHDNSQLKMSSFQMIYKFGMGREGAITIGPSLSDDEKKKVAEEVYFLIGEVVRYVEKYVEENNLLIDE